MDRIKSIVKERVNIQVSEEHLISSAVIGLVDVGLNTIAGGI